MLLYVAGSRNRSRSRLERLHYTGVDVNNIDVKPACET